MDLSKDNTFFIEVEEGGGWRVVLGSYKKYTKNNKNDKKV